ncbi:hypothetical protein Pelo_1110 [Pelomyxa schiedti]|nr:hypothetical protein Pelo_1110 [Pelomyxa schiedti]
MKEASPTQPSKSVDEAENNSWSTDNAAPGITSCSAVVPNFSGPVGGTFERENSVTAESASSVPMMLQQQVTPSQGTAEAQAEALYTYTRQQFLESSAVMHQAIEQGAPFHPLPLRATANPEGFEDQLPIGNGSTGVLPGEAAVITDETIPHDQQSGGAPHSFQGPDAAFTQYAHGSYPPETNGFAGGDQQLAVHSPSFNADPATFLSQGVDHTQVVNQMPNLCSAGEVRTESCAAPLPDPSNFTMMPMPSPACVNHPSLGSETGSSPLDPLISKLSDFLFPEMQGIFIPNKGKFLLDLISYLEGAASATWEHHDYSHQFVLDLSCQLLKGRYLTERFTMLCAETNAVLIDLSAKPQKKKKAPPSQAPAASSCSVEQPPHESPPIPGPPPIYPGMDLDEMPMSLGHPPPSPLTMSCFPPPQPVHDHIPPPQQHHQPQQQYPVQVFVHAPNTQPHIPQPPTPLPVPMFPHQPPPPPLHPQQQQQQQQQPAQQQGVLTASQLRRRLRRKMAKLCIWQGMQLKYFEAMLMAQQRGIPPGIAIPLPTAVFPHCCFTVDDNHVKELWQWVRLCRAMLESEPSENTSTPSRQSPGDSSNS